MDTLKQYDRLRASGFSDAQARTRVAAMARARAQLAAMAGPLSLTHPIAKGGFAGRGDFADQMAQWEARWDSKLSELFDGLRNDIYLALALFVVCVATGAGSIWFVVLRAFLGEGG